MRLNSGGTKGSGGCGALSYGVLTDGHMKYRCLDVVVEGVNEKIISYVHLKKVLSSQSLLLINLATSPPRPLAKDSP